MDRDDDEKGWDGFLDPPSLEILRTARQHHELLVPTLEWLTSRLRERLADELHGFELKVLDLRYISVYPTIALRICNREIAARNPHTVYALEKRCEEVAEETLRDATVLDFLRFATRSPRRWSDAANEMLAPGEELEKHPERRK